MELTSTEEGLPVGTNATLLVVIPEYTMIKVGSAHVTLMGRVEGYVVGAEAPQLAEILKRQRGGKYV